MGVGQIVSMFLVLLGKLSDVKPVPASHPILLIHTHQSLVSPLDQF